MIAPHELKKSQFSRAMRGYSSEEVDKYIKYLVDNYTQLYRAYGELEAKMNAVITQNNELVKTNEAAKNALEHATKEANTILDEAKEEADYIRRSAKISCDNIINEFRIRITEEKEKLIKTQNAISKYKEQLYKECQLHIDLIENFTELADWSDLDLPDDVYNRRIVTDIKTDLATLMSERPSEPVEPTYGGPDPVLFDLATEQEKQDLTESEPEVAPEATIDIVQDVDDSSFTREFDTADDIPEAIVPEASVPLDVEVDEPELEVEVYEEEPEILPAVDADVQNAEASTIEEVVEPVVEAEIIDEPVEEVIEEPEVVEVIENTTDKEYDEMLEDFAKEIARESELNNNEE